MSGREGRDITDSKQPNVLFMGKLFLFTSYPTTLMKDSVEEKVTTETESWINFANFFIWYE